MPRAAAISKAIALAVTLAAVVCASAVSQPAFTAGAHYTEVSATAAMPRNIRSGFAEMAVQRVESGVSQEEVAAAVQAMLHNSPACISLPALWLESRSRRVFVVRFDLMARDWGEQVAAQAEARMAELVDLGLLTRRQAEGLDPRAMEYQLTEEGRLRLDGRLEPGFRPRFCGPSERRLVEITDMQWGAFECGSLRVSFTHVADDWPSWAHTEAGRARLADDLPPPGDIAQGAVSLSRQWYRRGDLPEGFLNGSLTSACFDEARGEIVGSDLNLAAGVR